MNPAGREADGRAAAPLRAMLARGWRGLISVAVFSGFVNLLMLVSPIYMLQVYDRVLSSASFETLIALTAVAAFLLACFGGLDWVRQRMMARLSLSLGSDAVDRVLASTFRGGLDRAQRSAGQPVRDLSAICRFIASPPALAFFDAPWAPVFAAAIFLIHPWLGLLALFGGAAILALAVSTEWTSRGPYRRASEHAVGSQRFVENSLRHADILAAMGMFEGFRRRWRDRHDRGVAFQARGGARLGGFLSASRAVRQMVQVGILGLGAFLVLRQEITPGMMIAAAIILGRALAPIEQGISAWRGFVMVREAWRRLDALILAAPPDSGPQTALPRPEGRLEVEAVTAAPPGVERPVLRGVGFVLEPGTATALVGPSGSGKSTLARLLVGVWSPQAGSVRLDGAAVSDWPAASRFRHVGYLPQEAELFEASVADNIARLATPDDEAVVAAARLAGCHDMVMRLPGHYDTAVAAGGANLSAGQRRRVALARALYGDPALAVLDEPDSNLDSEGLAALIGTLAALAERKVTVLLTTHNLRLLQIVDRVLVLRGGVLADAGRREEVLQRFLRPARESA